MSNILQALYNHLFKLFTLKHDGTGLNTSSKVMYVLAVTSTLPLTLYMTEGAELFIRFIFALFAALLTTFLLNTYTKTTIVPNILSLTILGVNIIRMMVFLAFGQEVLNSVFIFLLIFEIIILGITIPKVYKKEKKD